MSANVNPYEAASRPPESRYTIPPSQQADATSAIQRLAPDPDAALIALAACGLTDPYQPLPGIPDAAHSTRRHPGAATHGCRDGVAWHREQRTRLCSPCRKWEAATERIHTLKEGA